MAYSPASHFIKAAWEKHLPITVSIELSTACNLKCVHCYNFDRSNPPKQKRAPLSDSRIFRLIEEVSENGGFTVSFTGGEPMMHGRIFDFIAHATSKQLATKLKTNATLITLEKAKKLKQSGLRGAEVSIYGATPKNHDAFTTKDGSLRRTIQGAKNLMAQDIPTSLSFIMHKKNVDELSDMIALANSIGAQFQIATDLTERYDGTTSSVNYRMEKEDLIKLYNGPEKERFKGAINDQDHIACGCARTVAGINEFGDMFPCIGAPIYCGNVNEDSFANIWKNSQAMNQIRNYELQDFKDCAGCSTRKYCQRSSGAVYTNTGDYTGKEDWFCKQADLLKELNS